jgi:putative transposase
MGTVNPMRSFECKLYPTDEQKQYLIKVFGHVRFVYNHILSDLLDEYDGYKEGVCKKPVISDYSLLNRVRTLKLNNEWLYDVPDRALRLGVSDLTRAFVRFFSKSIKSGYPKHRSKSSSTQSFRLTDVGYKIIGNTHLKIAKLDQPIRMRGYGRHRFVEGTKTVTVIRRANGHYYAVFTGRVVPHVTNGTGAVGIDLGLTDLLVTSDGTKVPNPKYLEQSLRKLRRASKALSRKQKGSANRTKAKLRVAKRYAKITNQTNDFLHKLSRALVNDNQVIGIETLRVANMMRNHRLARHIAQSNWSKFTDMLASKVTESQHCILVKMAVNYASTQLCSHCGDRPTNRLTLRDRAWTCTHCDTYHDRDINAAKNMLHTALDRIGAMVDSLRGQVILA